MPSSPPLQDPGYTSSNQPSKLTKFLPKASSSTSSPARDRSKSVGSEVPGAMKPRKKRSPADVPPLPTSKQPQYTPDIDDDLDTPVIIERPTFLSPGTARTSSPRIPSSSSFYSSAPASHSTSRLNDLPSKLSGWLSHFSSGQSGNSSDTSLSSVLSHNPNAAKLALGSVSNSSKGRLSISHTPMSRKERDRQAKSTPPPPSHPTPTPTPPPPPLPQQIELSSSTSSNSSFKIPGAVSHAAKSSSRVVDRAFRYLRDTDHWEGEGEFEEEEIWYLGTRYSHYPTGRPDSYVSTSISNPAAKKEDQEREEDEKAKATTTTTKKKHAHQHSLSSASASSGASRLSMSNDHPNRHHSPHHSGHTTHSNSNTYQSANTSATSFHSQLQAVEDSSETISPLGVLPTPPSSSDSKGGYPNGFYDDFISTVWLTYRKEFGMPIRDTRLTDLERFEDLIGGGEVQSPPTSRSSSANNNNRNSNNTTNTRKSNAHRSSDEHSSYHSSSSTSYSTASSSSSRSGGIPTPSKNKWINISLNSIGMAERVGRSGLLGEKGWTSDTGWGCMLRTGQSLLVESLVRVWVGKGYRPFDHVEERTVERAKWVRLLSWFMDHPSGEAPFSVHRMALAGKELGKDVGMWFGPSTAAGAIRTLVNAFPGCKLGVSVASDGMLFQTEVFAASHSPLDPDKRKSGASAKKNDVGWGDRAVLVLFGIRLGIEGVNPIYYETIKQIYTIPQTIGIAGGRPSSSYYFVGVQGGHHLFYLDPHQTRTAIPFKPVSGDVWNRRKRTSGVVVGGKEGDKEERNPIDEPVVDPGRAAREREERERAKTKGRGSMSPSVMFPHDDLDDDDDLGGEDGADDDDDDDGYGGNEIEDVVNVGGGKNVLVVGRKSTARRSSGHSPNSSFVDFGDEEDEDEEDDDDDDVEDGYDEDVSNSSSYPDGKRRERKDTVKPKPRGSQLSSSSSQPIPPSKRERRDTAKPTTRSRISGGGGISPSIPMPTTSSPSPPPPRSTQQGTFSISDLEMPSPPLDPLVSHYLDSYSQEELTTFHCDRVKRMPMSGLDPSMLIGFLVTDEEDWKDLRRRVSELPKAIFSIGDVPPTWAGDFDSVGSDDGGLESISEPEEEEEEEEEEILVEKGKVRNLPKSTSSRSRDLDFEEDGSDDGVDPVTPGPTRQSFVISKVEEEDFDDWVESGMAPSSPSTVPPPVIPSGGPGKYLAASSPPPVPTKKKHSHSSTKDRSSSSSSAPSAPSKSKSSSSSSTVKSKSKSKSHSSSSTDPRRSSGKRKEQPVPVPPVRHERLPFPVAEEEDEDEFIVERRRVNDIEEEEDFVEMVRDDLLDEDDGDGQRTRKSSVIYVAGNSSSGGGQVGGGSGFRGYAVRARDGGRTASGGVRGILNEDSC